MNIEKTSNFWLSKLFKTLAILLVLFALFSSSLRLLLPYVGTYKTELEDYINDNYNTQVSIGSLSMSWRNLGPVLIVKNVQLLETEQTDIYIKEFDLQVDIWKSLTRQMLVSERLVLMGAKISIDEGLWKDEQEKEQIAKPDDSTQSTAVNATLQQEAKESFAFTQVANLFLNRISRFSIIDSEINIGAEKERSFEIVRIRWLNDGDTHKAQGRVILDDLSDTQVKVSINLKGDDPQELNGGVYLHANKLDITPWLSQFLSVNNDNSSSSIGFDAWGRIRHSELDRLHVDLHENEVVWYKPNRQKIKLAPAQVLLAQNKSKNGFTLYSTPFRLSVNNKQAEPFNLYMKKRDEKLTGHMSSLDMAIASKILPLFVQDAELQKTLSQLSLTGTVDDIYLYNQPDDFIVNATLNNISTHYSGGIPGIKNISGNLNFHNDKLTLDASSQNGEIDLEKHFMLPIPYNTLSMSTEFIFNEQGWTLAVNEVDITSPELNLTGSLKVNAPKNGESTMSLLMGIVDGDASLAEHYYPKTLMSENLFNYLDTSLLDGELTQANILFNGPLSNFPFKDNSGIFVVDAEIKDGTFKFADSWAPITLFTANLNFTNEGMMITGRNGFLTDLNIKGVKVGIADLGQNQTLTVDAIVQPVEAHEFTKLLQQSPYKGSVGAALETLNVV
ncbi:MAG: YhdP family protein, partial [Colwellia sp.]